MPVRPWLLKPIARQIVRSVQSAILPIIAKYGRLPKWTQTTFQHGVRVEEAWQRTAKCSALLTIGLKGIDKMDVPTFSSWAQAESWNRRICQMLPKEDNRMM